MRTGASVAILSGLLGTAGAALAQTALPAPLVEATATAPTQQGGANRAVLVAGETPFIVGTAELAGLEIYDLSGKRIGSVDAGEAVGVDVRYGGVAGGATSSPILVAADARSNALRFYRAQGQALSEVSARPVPLGIAVEGVCLSRSVQDGSLYAFAVGDGGEVDQYLLFETPAGTVDARQVRRLRVPSTAEHCVGDDATGQLYVSEQAVGIWRFDADPEAEVVPTLIDAARLGHITEEVGGLALLDGGAGAQWLLASNASAGQLFVYDHSKDDAYVGTVAISAAGKPLEEPGGLYATSVGAPGAASGTLLIADEDGGSNYKIVPIDKFASGLGINAGQPQPLFSAVSPTFPIVRPTVETVAVANAGDAADDPAIWANPADPAASLIVGTAKKGGLHVYDMSGQSLQFVPDGKMNNVDLREGFKLGGEQVVLVTASDRTTKGVAIYRLDSANKRLVNVSDGIQATGLSDPYGLCMYRNPRSGRQYVYVSDPDGLVRQWELVASKAGKVRLKQVRDIRFSSQTEGCVADDQTGVLYVGEEDIGLWRISAEPGRGSGPVAVDKVATNPKIKDDIEGVGIYDLGNGRGYIIASSQGNNSYAVYRREGDRAYLGSFSVIADPAKGIDGISETDGLEISSANLGPGFESGAMVAQDGRNVMPTEYQNFKMVPWSAIAKALNLEVRR